jgi:hypothetical protein
MVGVFESHKCLVECELCALRVELCPRLLQRERPGRGLCLLDGRGCFDGPGLAVGADSGIEVEFAIATDSCVRLDEFGGTCPENATVGR